MITKRDGWLAATADYRIAQLAAVRELEEGDNFDNDKGEDLDE